MRDFNFFAPYQGKQKNVANKKKYIISISTFLVLTILGSLTYNMVNIYLLDKEVKKYNENLNASEIQDKVKEAEEYNRKMSILKKYDTAIDDINNRIDKRYVITSQLLSDINSKIPKDISFVSISIKDSTITLKGTGKSRQDIADFQHGLKALDFISDVEISTINADEENPGLYKFDLKSTLKDVGNNEG